MINKFCTCLTTKIRKEMPDVDDEKAEVIQYGLELIIGEIPKLVLTVALAFILKIGWLVLLTYIVLLPYKVSSGGFHCKTHFGCFAGTCIMYFGTVFIAKYINFEPLYLKYIIAFLVLVFGIIMVSLYAPADTENVPILSIKERNKKKILSYVFLTINILVAVIVPYKVVSNIFIVGTFIHTCTITKLAYKLTKNKYGFQAESLG